MMGRMYVMNDLRSDSKLVQEVVDFVLSDEFEQGSTLVGNGSTIALCHDIWESDLTGCPSERVQKLNLKNRIKLVATLKPIADAVKKKQGEFYLLGGGTELPVEDFDYEWIGMKGFSREQDRFMDGRAARAILKKEQVGWRPYFLTRGKVLLVGVDALDDGIDESFLELFEDVEVVICPYLPVVNSKCFPFVVEMTKTDKRRMESLTEILQALPRKSITCVGGHFCPESGDTTPDQIVYDMRMGEKQLSCVWNRPGVVLNYIEIER